MQNIITDFKDVDSYIAIFPQEVQLKLQQLRKSIMEAAPQAEEVISYKMPAYKYKGMLVYFAGYKKHIGFYPTASGIANFIDEFATYKTSKGAVQFPVDKPLPIALIKRIVKYRIKENTDKATAKSK